MSGTADLFSDQDRAGDARVTRQSRERADCLYRAISRLVGVMTVEEVIEVVFRDALPLLQAHVAVAFLLSEDGQEFHALRISGPSEKERQAWQSFPATTPILIADVVRTGQPLVLADLAEHDARYPLFIETRAVHGEGISLAFPFLVHGRAIGGIGLLLPEYQVFDADDHAFLTTLADMCAQALERTRLHQRERHIAQTLQEALQPPIPGRAPGLGIAHFIKSALEESSVGGDFADVFTVRDGCTCLIVGDLSGKGLAAATQVAAVRHMLRYALYDNPALAISLTRLNQVLHENALLAGFATLFLGCYDAKSGRLTYVNCGQEPGLVRREATGQVVALPPTGPVLGAFDGTYTETSVLLEAGDALIVFSDGLTEAGPNYRDLLGLSGVTAMLTEGGGYSSTPGDSSHVAQSLVSHLVGRVYEYAAQRVRDDVCLLVAVADPPGI